MENVHQSAAERYQTAPNPCRIMQKGTKSLQSAAKYQQINAERSETTPNRCRTAQNGPTSLRNGTKRSQSVLAPPLADGGEGGDRTGRPPPPTSSRRTRRRTPQHVACSGDVLCGVMVEGSQANHRCSSADAQRSDAAQTMAEPQPQVPGMTRPYVVLGSRTLYLGQQHTGKPLGNPALVIGYIPT